MIDHLSQVPHLIRLLQDKDHHVRNIALREIASLGPNLAQSIIPHLEDIPQHLVPYMHLMIDNSYRDWLEERFIKLFQLAHDDVILERGFSLLAQFQNGHEYYTTLNLELHKLATEFIYLDRPQTHDSLIEFLFHERGFSGVENDYYNPLNSNLVYVLENRKGIPISLSCLLIILGNLLNIPFEACPFPSHFMARYKNEDDVWIFVDGFNSGKQLKIENLLELNLMPPEKAIESAFKKVSALQIFIRVLNNMSFAYAKQLNPLNAQFMQKIGQSLVLQQIDFNKEG